jgi:hypothetical protein
MQIRAPARRLSIDAASVRVSVHSLAGQSAGAEARYAGLPRVSEVINPRDRRRLDGAAGADDAGGAPVRVLGRGFAGQLTGPLRFQGSNGFPYGSQYVYRVAGNSELDASTVGDLPGLTAVRVCTVTGCSTPTRAGGLLLYPLGAPLVSRVRPRSGPPGGGTKLVIDGQNLSCAVQVYFGRRKARSLRAITPLTDCGVSTQVRATAPAGTPGTTVPVTVETAESYFTGAGHGRSHARFRYTP